MPLPNNEHFLEKEDPVANAQFEQALLDQKALFYSELSGLSETVEELKKTDIQYMLKNLDFYKGNIDGIFGKVTGEAVKAFQKAHKLPVDGILGENTLSILQMIYGEYLVSLPNAYTWDDGRQSNNQTSKTKLAVSDYVITKTAVAEVKKVTDEDVNKHLDALSNIFNINLVLDKNEPYDKQEVILCLPRIKKALNQLTLDEKEAIKNIQIKLNPQGITGFLSSEGWNHAAIAIDYMESSERIVADLREGLKYTQNYKEFRKVGREIMDKLGTNHTISEAESHLRDFAPMLQGMKNLQEGILLLPQEMKDVFKDTWVEIGLWNEVSSPKVITLDYRNTPYQMFLELKHLIQKRQNLRGVEKNYWGARIGLDFKLLGGTYLDDPAQKTIQQVPLELLRNLEEIEDVYEAQIWIGRDLYFQNKEVTEENIQESWESILETERKYYNVPIFKGRNVHFFSARESMSETFNTTHKQAVKDLGNDKRFAPLVVLEGIEKQGGILYHRHTEPFGWGSLRRQENAIMKSIETTVDKPYTFILAGHGNATDITMGDGLTEAMFIDYREIADAFITRYRNNPHLLQANPEDQDIVILKSCIQHNYWRNVLNVLHEEFGPNKTYPIAILPSEYGQVSHTKYNKYAGPFFEVCLRLGNGETTTIGSTVKASKYREAGESNGKTNTTIYIPTAKGNKQITENEHFIKKVSNFL